MGRIQLPPEMNCLHLSLSTLSMNMSTALRAWDEVLVAAASPCKFHTAAQCRLGMGLISEGAVLAHDTAGGPLLATSLAYTMTPIAPRQRTKMHRKEMALRISCATGETRTMFSHMRSDASGAGLILSLWTPRSLRFSAVQHLHCERKALTHSARDSGSLKVTKAHTESKPSLSFPSIFAFVFLIFSLSLSMRVFWIFRRVVMFFWVYAAASILRSIRLSSWFARLMRALITFPMSLVTATSATVPNCEKSLFTSSSVASLGMPHTHTV